MKIKNHIKKYLNVNKIAAVLRFIPDTLYLKLRFRIRVGYKLDVKNPLSFNEKIQWLKLYDRLEIYHTIVDKEQAKKYVAKRIGKEYIIPTLGIWNHWDEIDFAKLPDQFVLKCTHDSGGVVICSRKEKFNIKNAKKIIQRSLTSDFFWIGREWPYKNLKPQIIAEQFIGKGTDLIDYKFMCFNGKVKTVFTCSNRSTKDGTLNVTFYDVNWKRMPFERHYPADPNEIHKPHNYDKMVELAEILSKDHPFIRVDFYEVNEKIYFGELTLYPGNGLEEFTPRKWDYILGSWLQLPDRIHT